MTEQAIPPQIVQAAHRRITAAKAAGHEPTEADRAVADQVNASPFAHFDRAWRRDED